MLDTGLSNVHIVISGADGKSVLSAGHVLAGAALNKYEHVLWFPNYAASTPDGDGECSVVLAEREVLPPISLQPSAAIVTGRAARKRMEERVEYGGVLVLDSSVLPEKVARDDLRVYSIPATEVASELGVAPVANLVLLGAFLEATKILPVEMVQAELERHLRAAQQEDLLPSHSQALQRGVELASGIQA